MPKIERKIFAGDKMDLRNTIEDLNKVNGLFNKGTRIYIAEAPSFRQVVYDLVSRGFNALGFMGVIDVVILLTPDKGEVHSIILLHGYDDMGQLSTETIWPLPQKPPPGIKYHLPKDCPKKAVMTYGRYDNEISCSLCRPERPGDPLDTTSPPRNEGGDEHGRS